jgi:pimeloyl-ACP methyl ester carboxylesterase
VWAIDQRNHGRSPHSEEFNYDVMAEDLRDFMEQQGIGKAHLLGHSMGGKTVMQFSFRWPEKINKLIVADISPRGYDESHNEIIDALQGMDLSAMTRRGDAEAMLRSRGFEEGVIQFLLKNLTREASGFRWKMNLPAIVENYRAIIGPVDRNGVFNGPALFIRGTASDYITDTDKAEILKQFPQAQFFDMEGVGHWVHAEAPMPFLQAVLGFLSGEVM